MLQSLNVTTGDLQSVTCKEKRMKKNVCLICRFGTTRKKIIVIDGARKCWVMFGYEATVYHGTDIT